MSNTINPIVSVVIPVYNGMPFIAQTIESVRRQSYVYWELIICDNCSTDNTVEYIRQKQKEYSDHRISLVTHDAHLPLVLNWNRSLSYAKQEFIKMLPSDDILLTHCLEIQVRLLQENVDAGFVTSGKELINALGKILFTRTPLKNGKYDWQALGKPSLYAVSNLIGEPGGILFRAELSKTCGIFNPQLKYYIDLDLWLRFLKISKLLVSEKALYQFRIHAKSESASSRQVSIAEYFQFLDLYEQELQLSNKPFLQMYLYIKVYLVVFLRSFIFWLSGKYFTPWPDPESGTH